MRRGGTRGWQRGHGGPHSLADAAGSERPLTAAVLPLVVLVFLGGLPSLSPPLGANAQGSVGVLLNVTEQLDPLVAMNLTVLQFNQTYNCNATVNGTLKHINGRWVSECDPPMVNMTSLNVSALTDNAVPSLPLSISNLFTLTQLTMSGIGLQGALPSTLGFMGFMRQLNLSSNNFNGTFPATLCILTNLTSLDLNANRLTGEINPAIGNVVSLSHIDVGGNFLNGTILQNLANLTSLSHLDVSGRPDRPFGSLSAFSDQLNASFFANLTGLTYLNLSFSNITGNITALGTLSNLKELDVTSTSIAGPYPPSFASFPYLTSILADNSSAFCKDMPSLSSTSCCGSSCLAASNSTYFCKSICQDYCFCPYTFPLWAIITIVVGAAVLVMIGLVIAYYVLRAQIFNDGVEVHGVRRFSLPELEEATDNYSIALGKGGFGEVFKGVVSVEDGSEREVAVKRTKAERRRNMKKFDSGFRNEILVLSGVRHRNLVELIGYSSKGADVMLVYDFISRGSLDDLLKKEMNEDGVGEYNLTWERRLKVAFGAAQGLDYLHSGVTPPIIHRDIKSSNILVNDDYAAFVADFGLSKIRPEMEMDGGKTLWVQGTMGYIDPEYATTLKPTEMSDVYSFGVVLLELATGWRPIGGPEKKHIIQRVAKGVNSAGFDSIVAPSIRKELELGSYTNDDGDSSALGSDSLPPRGKPTTAVLYEADDGDGDKEIVVASFTTELFQRFVKLGMQCCAKDSTTRPTMRIVAKALGEMIEGKSEDTLDDVMDGRFEEEGGEEVVVLAHNLGGEEGATVAFIMESQAGPR